ncbi:MAG: electron transport complex subunit RsxA [Pseudomonadota bacterium]|nr:electron transport complex subunit RsxA [Pseudomonadota bacterium]
MQEYLLILVSTVLVNNFVLAQFLGLCPFVGVSNKLESAIGMSMATVFVLTLTSVLSYLTYRYLLQPLELTYLRTLVFIFLIAAIVQFTELFIRKTSPALHRVLGLFLPLITSNCAVLGVALLTIKQEETTLASAFFYGLGASVGFAFVLIAFSAMRERLALSDVPQAFQGLPIALVTAGLMSLAFLGFAGLA